jgi:adenylate cyclase
MRKFLKSRRLFIDICTAFVGLMALSAFIIIYISYQSHTKVLMRLATDIINSVTNTVIEKNLNYFLPTAKMTDLAAKIAENKVIDAKETDKIEQFGIQIMKSYPQVISFYYGDENGNFVMPKILPDKTMATKIILRNKNEKKQIWRYRDKTGKQIKTEVFKNIDYDPRIRPWYKGAKKNKKIFWTKIYMHFTSQKLGITVAAPVFNEKKKLQGVFGLDLELSELSKFMESIKIGQNGFCFIVNNYDEIVAYPLETTKIIKNNNQMQPIKMQEMDNLLVHSFAKEYQSRKEARFKFVFGSSVYFGIVKKFPSSFQKNWSLMIIVPEDDFLGVAKKNNINNLIFSILVLIIGIILAFWISKNISKPIVLLTRETKKIKDFQLTEKKMIHSSIKEIQLMSEALASMKHGLKAFQKYVPAALVRKLIKTGEEAKIGGNKRDVTIFFSDIAGFTTIAENIEAEELMIQVSEYLDDLTRAIHKNYGTVDKYIGDAIMAFWGAPMEDEKHVYHACKAALLCQEKIEKMNKKWVKAGKSVFNTRIGLHTGETIVGNMGSSERMNYTLIGDNVNLTSRLEGINKLYKTNVLVSEAVYDQVKSKFYFRPIDIVAVKGKKKEIKIYELLGKKGCVLKKLEKEFLQAYEEAFNLFYEKEFKKAYQIFKKLLKKHKDDEPTKIYLRRAERYMENLPKDWTGITIIDSK